MSTTIRRRTFAVTVLALGLGAGSVVSLSAPAHAGDKPVARAVLHDTAGREIGEVVFKGPGAYADRVEVDIDGATSNPGQFHGLHVHTTGVCDPSASGSQVPFGSSGGHWNPTAETHGHHAGDLPSILITEDGDARAEFETDRLDVASLLAGDGSAVVVHAGPDNFANIPLAYGPVNATTLATGDAGARYACGVVTAVTTE